MFAKDFSNETFSPERHQGTNFFIIFFLCVLVPLCLIPVYPDWVPISRRLPNLAHGERIETGQGHAGTAWLDGLSIAKGVGFFRADSNLYIGVPAGKL